MTIRYITVPWHTEPVHIPGLGIGQYPLENGLQIYCVDSLGADRENWHHSANERKGLQAGLMAKRLGQQPGWPDLINLGRRLALEFKVGTNQLSPNQKIWQTRLIGWGFTYTVVRTYSQFLTATSGLSEHPAKS